MTHSYPTSFSVFRFGMGRSSRVVFAAGLGIVAGSSASSQVTGDWTRHFRAGAAVTLNIKADFTVGGQLGLSGNNPGALNTPGVDHVYDDGYVRVDRTGNAGGLTSYWGYQNASQYDSANNRLAMHSTQSFTTGQSTVRESNGVDVGMDLAYGSELWLWGKTLVGWDLGFGYLPLSLRDTHPLSGTSVLRTDYFDTTGLPFLPSHPYNGGASGTGPLISGTATAGPTTVQNDTLTGRRQLDSTLYNLRLGPTFYWDIGRRWALTAGAGFAMGIVDSTYKFNEASSSGQNSGRFGGVDEAYGGYANAMVMWRTAEKADLYLGAQFMSLSDVNVNGPGRSARLRLGAGVLITAGINWPF